MNLYKNQNIATLKARYSDSSIFLNWYWMNDTVPQYVQKTLVFYTIEGHSNVHPVKRLENSSKTEYVLTNVRPDVNYNICIRAMMNSKWPGVRDPQICTSVFNNRWEMSAFLGSTAGALLALFLIILLVIMSKRVKKRQSGLKGSVNQNSQRQRYDSAFESQFDSVAIRDDTSFYDELAASEVAYTDTSIRLSSEDSSTSSNMPSLVTFVDGSCSKKLKKRTSLIEEESSLSQSCDGLMFPINSKHNDNTYQNFSDRKIDQSSSSVQPTEAKGRIIETCIDEVDSPKDPKEDTGCKDNTLRSGLDKSPRKNILKYSQMECLKTL